MDRPKESESSDEKDPRVREIQDILLDPEGVAKVLPEAIIRRSSKDEMIAKSLAPTVAKSVSLSIKRNPEPVAEALFPIIGPAIRKSVTHAIRGMVDTINRALQNSFSLKGIAWRLEAMRTGRSFAEIVILKTLGYRLEQVFLIHRKTGLLLAQETAEMKSSRDPDMVSAMLTAIQDFVHDSFAVDTAEELETLQVGEVNVWIEQGPLAVLACVVRGNPPATLKTVMQEIMETIHLEYGERLGSFEGDAEVFEDVRPFLRECLEISPEEKAGEEKRSKIPLWAVLLTCLLLLAVVGLGLRHYNRTREFNTLVSAFHATPGYVLVEAKRTGNRYRLSGMRDLLAPTPESVVSRSGVESQRVVTRFRAFISLDPQIVLERARSILKPPDSVSMELLGDRLVISGEASAGWIKEAGAWKRFLPGIRKLDLKNVKTWERLTRKLEGVAIFFRTNTMMPERRERNKIDEVSSILERMARLGEDGRRRIRITLHGHSSDSGTEAVNHRLRAGRARWVAEALRSRMQADSPVEIVEGNPDGSQSLGLKKASVTMTAERVAEGGK